MTDDMAAVDQALGMESEDAILDQLDASGNPAAPPPPPDGGGGEAPAPPPPPCPPPSVYDRNLAAAVLNRVMDGALKMPVNAAQEAQVGQAVCLYLEHELGVPLSRLGGGGDPTTPRGWLLKCGGEYAIAVFVYSPVVPWPKVQTFVRDLLGVKADEPPPGDGGIPFPADHDPASGPASVGG